MARVNNLRTRSLSPEAEDDGAADIGVNALFAAPTTAPAAAPAASSTPTPEQWQRITNGETMIIGGVYYYPERTGQTGSAEQGDVAGGELTGRILRYTDAGGGASYDVLDTSGNVVGASTFSKPGNIFDLTGQFAKDMAPLAAAALGVNALGAALGQPSIFGAGAAAAPAAAAPVAPAAAAPVAPALTGYDAAMADLAASAPTAAPAAAAPALTGYDAAMADLAASAPMAASAAAPAAVNALAAPTAINTLSSATGLTPAALEAAIGTPGYGTLAAETLAASTAPSLVPSAGFAGMSAADFGMSGAQTAAYDAAIAAGAAPEAAAAAANAAPGIGAPEATAATTAAANAAARGATAVDPFQFIIPAASSLIGGVLSANAAEKAAEATGAATTRAAELQYQAQKEALDLQKRMYDEAVARQKPYYDAGTNALTQIKGLTGAMPPAFQYRPEQLTTDPGYGFRLSEGLKALERSAAARGGLLSGGTGKALTRYGQEMGSQEFGNAFNRSLTEYNALRQREAEEYNRLAGLAGVGGTTAQQLTSAGQQYGQQAGNLLTGTASNVGNLMAGQGQTAANALLASGSAYQRSAGDIASLYARMYGPQPTYLYPGMVPPGG